MNSTGNSERYNERITRAVGVEWNAYHEGDLRSRSGEGDVFPESRPASERREAA